MHSFVGSYNLGIKLGMPVAWLGKTTGFLNRPLFLNFGLWEKSAKSRRLYSAFSQLLQAGFGFLSLLISVMPTIPTTYKNNNLLNILSFNYYELVKNKSKRVEKGDFLL